MESNPNKLPLDPAVVQQLTRELEALDEEMVELEGRQLKPSHCYRVNLDPVHVLFNTNCPDSLKEKVEALLTKHLGTREDDSQDPV